MRKLFLGKDTTLKSVMHPVVKFDSAKHIQDIARTMVDKDLNYVIILNNGKYFMLRLTDITPEALKSNKPVNELPLPRILVFEESSKISEVYEYIKNYPAILVKNDDDESIEGIVTMEDYMKTF